MLSNHTTIVENFTRVQYLWLARSCVSRRKDQFDTKRSVSGVFTRDFQPQNKSTHPKVPEVLPSRKIMTY